MPDPRASLPPTGVSRLNEAGQSVPEAKEAKEPKRRGRGRRTKPGEDVLKNPDAGVQIGADAAPPGTGRVQRDVREFPVKKTKRSARHSADWVSIDGQKYSVRTHNTRGEAVPTREVQCLFAAVREMRLGGDPFTVFDAFRLNLKDQDGRIIYPVPAELMEAVDGPLESDPLPEAEQDDSSFSLAED